MGEKNLFLIARSRLGPEDQLTEMLAYLWQERPELIDPWLNSLSLVVESGPSWEVATQLVDKESGRFDVVLERPGSAVIIIESKLGAGLEDSQLGRYVRYLRTRAEPVRALVALTQAPASVSDDLLALARAAGVRFVQARWQDFAVTTAEPHEETLQGDFVRMLVAEGLVKPDAITSEHWTRWNRGAHVLSVLETLLGEARPQLERLSPGLKATGRYGLSTRWIYRLLSSDRISVGLGFSANRSASDPSSRPIIFAPVKNLELASDQSKGRAEEAARAVGGSVLWGDYPYVTQPVEEVLTTEDFREQVDQSVRYVYEGLVAFRDAGYLPPDLSVAEPD
jgi:hypothetical protein